MVVVVRSVMGKKEFNQFRGKAISLHSQGALPTGRYCVKQKRLDDSDALLSTSIKQV